MVAALDLFAERGYENTTVIEIAERAGLTKSTFFRSGTPRCLSAPVMETTSASPFSASRSCSSGLAAITARLRALNSRRPGVNVSLPTASSACPIASKGVAVAGAAAIPPASSPVIVSPPKSTSRLSAKRRHHIVVDTHDLPGLARFWTQALGWKVLSERDREIVIGPAENAPVGICFMPVTDPKTVKNRVHLDLTSSAADRDQEIGRLITLGARRVDIGQTGTESWTVLADPEGNEFCVVRPKQTLTH